MGERMQDGKCGFSLNWRRWQHVTDKNPHKLKVTELHIKRSIGEKKEKKVFDAFIHVALVEALITPFPP